MSGGRMDLDAAKDHVIENVVRMLRLTGPTWTQLYPDDVSLESHVRDVIYEGIKSARANAGEWRGFFGTGGILIEYEVETQSTTVAVLAGYHYPADEEAEEPEQWLVPGRMGQAKEGDDEA